MKKLALLLVLFCAFGFKSEIRTTEDFVHYYVYSENLPFKVNFTDGDGKTVLNYVNEHYWRKSVYPKNPGVYKVICETIYIQKGDSMFCSAQYRNQVEESGICSDLKTTMIIHKRVEVY